MDSSSSSNNPLFYPVPRLTCVRMGRGAPAAAAPPALPTETDTETTIGAHKHGAVKFRNTMGTGLIFTGKDLKGASIMMDTRSIPTRA